MEYKEYIKAGNKVLHVPYIDDWTWYDQMDARAEVVTIGEYRPYYTDGEMSDPTPDEYEGCCRVECDGTKYDCQIRLDRLFPIEQKEDMMLYEGKCYLVYGYAKGCGMYDLWLRDEDDAHSYCFLKDGDGLKVVDEDDVCTPRVIKDLSHDELERLWGDICRGSIYTDDYRNTVDVPDTLAEDAYEEFWRYLVDEYGEDKAEENDTAKEFADYYYGQLAA